MIIIVPSTARGVFNPKATRYCIIVHVLRACVRYVDHNIMCVLYNFNVVHDFADLAEFASFAEPVYLWL